MRIAAACVTFWLLAPIEAIAQSDAELGRLKDEISELRGEVNTSLNRMEKGLHELEALGEFLLYAVWPDEDKFKEFGGRLEKAAETGVPTIFAFTVEAMPWTVRDVLELVHFVFLLQTLLLVVQHTLKIRPVGKLFPVHL